MRLPCLWLVSWSRGHWQLSGAASLLIFLALMMPMHTTLQTLPVPILSSDLSARVAPSLMRPPIGYTFSGSPV
ncbi:hypothetical protein H4582DRAFT_1966116 [Lactarius indigo]|nr:hypothetical protein H4582DRAFT_1982717 [Lactarius indigo]KAI9436350.1 hypothetical protein H4582DRAFT_1966116 [Lactarius indigo]